MLAMVGILALSFTFGGCSDDDGATMPPPGEVAFSAEAEVVLVEGEPTVEAVFRASNGLPDDIWFTPPFPIYQLRDPQGNVYLLGWIIAQDAPPPFSVRLAAGATRIFEWTWDGLMVGPVDAMVPAPAGTYIAEQMFQYRVDPAKAPTVELTAEVTFDWPGR
jgi:hypothetical protein